MFGIDMGTIKPSVLNALMVLGIVIITVPLAKAVMTRFPVPGLAPLVQSI